MPTKTSGKSVASKRKAVARKARVLKTRGKLTGLNTRIKGQVSATTRRNQAKRDGKKG